MSTSRARRDVIRYATHDGQEKVKQRPLSAFAPAAAQKASAGKTAETSFHISAAVTEWVRRAAKAAKTAATSSSPSSLVSPVSSSASSILTSGKLTAGVGKAVEALLATPSGSSGSHLALRRVVLKSSESRFDALALAALELGNHHQVSSHPGKASALLFVTATDELAHKAAAYVTGTYGLPPPTLLDGSVRLPPPVSAQSAQAGEVAPLPIVISTVAALVAIDKRSALWKQMVYMMIDASDSQAPNSGSEPAQSEVVKVGHALSCERIVVVASSPAAAVQSKISWLFPSKGPQVALAAHSKHTSLRPSFDVNYIVAEGCDRFVHLYSLCSNQSKTLRIVVHVATPQVALFLANVFYALKFDAGQIVCDSEASVDGTSVAKRDQSPTVAKIDGLPAGTGCVLFSAFGLVPATGDVFIQYDPMLDIANMGSFIASQLTPGIARQEQVAAAAAIPATPVLAASATKSAAKRSRSTPPPTPTTSASAASFGASLAAPTTANYRHVIIFMNSNEVAGAVPLLKATGQRFNLTLTQLSPPRAATVLLTINKMASLHAKVFTIQQEAYEAYRATMQIYSRLQPTSVYDVAQVNLQSIGEQFGYKQPPLLDLRTKVTAFRPKEDYFKVAVRRLKHERQAFKEYAASNIIGELPEEDPDLA